MGGVLRLIVTLIGVFWLAIAGGAAVYWWDRRPAGVPTIRAPVLFFHWTWRAPDSLGAQLAVLQARERAAQARAVKVASAQAAVSQAAGAHFSAVQTVIRYRTRTLIQEVPDVITAEIDRGFPLSVGFVRLHDAAALGIGLSTVPEPPGKSDGDASAVTASDAVTVIAGNYGSARECVAQLNGLQQWVRDEAAASKP